MHLLISQAIPHRLLLQLRFINGAGFARMYLTIDDHNMVIVALDAVDIKPSNYTPIFIFSPGQRISILVCPKDAKVSQCLEPPQEVGQCLDREGPVP